MVGKMQNREMQSALGKACIGEAQYGITSYKKVGGLSLRAWLESKGRPGVFGRFATISLLAISLSACSGSKFKASEYAHSYANRNVNQNNSAYYNNGQYSQNCFLGVQAALTQPVFVSNAPECASGYAIVSSANTYDAGAYMANNLRGPSSPPYYNTYNEGTVLRGSAPYGRAVNDGSHSPYGYPRPKKTSGAYVGIGGIAYDVGDNFYGIQGRFGYNFNPNFALEGEASIGVKGESETLEGIDGGIPFTLTVKGDVDYSTGIFAVSRLPVGKNLSLHARAGYHLSQISAEIELAELGVSVSESASTTVGGPAFGAGVEIATGARNALRLDYTRYEDCAYYNVYGYTETYCNGGVNSASVSFVYKF